MSEPADDGSVEVTTTVKSHPVRDDDDIVGRRPKYMLSASIKRLDNGTLLTVRRKSTAGSVIVVERAYLQPQLLFMALAEYLQLDWPPR
jgi:hypothetical protein